MHSELARLVGIMGHEPIAIVGSAVGVEAHREDTRLRYASAFI